MNLQKITIHDIPACIWGTPSDKVILAIHGNLSHKADIPIQIVANQAVEQGYQLLSFDLPEHGDRKSKPPLCKVQVCVNELHSIMDYTKSKWKHISLFANSLGAYYALLAYANETIQFAWFLSPVLDMQRIIENMMQSFSISVKRLKLEQTISTPIHQTLYWDDYRYVMDHPIQAWNIPTSILYGEQDNLCEKDIIITFCDRYSCKLAIAESEHFFHTERQLEALKSWIQEQFLTNECLHKK